MNKYLFAVCALLPALAAGNDLLLDTNPLSEDSGYVLYSLSYLLPARAGEPCLKIHLKSVSVSADSGLKARDLDACHASWRENADASQSHAYRVSAMFLAAVPAGEYEVHDSSMRFQGVKITWTGDPPVVGIRSLHVKAGQVTYAGHFRLADRNGGNRAVLQVADGWFRDAPVFKRLRPDLDGLEVIKAIWDRPAR